MRKKEEIVELVLEDDGLLETSVVAIPALPEAHANLNPTAFRTKDIGKMGLLKCPKCGYVSKTNMKFKCPKCGNANVLWASPEECAEVVKSKRASKSIIAVGLRRIDRMKGV